MKKTRGDSEFSVNADDSVLLGDRVTMSLEIGADFANMEHHNDFDALHNAMPHTKNEDVVPWFHFNSDIYSSEYKGVSVLDEVVNVYPDEKIDLRPYILENPITVTIYTKFQRLVDFFRNENMRHLLVRFPHNGHLAGIITRQDIFAYMAL